jgi:pyruvate/2-oxoglutarate dehydrogenase complex dihydrolipoamide dehydrogenase (E3) component
MVLYTDIEVARVGKTEEEILQTISNQDFRTEALYFSLNDRSKISQDTQGFIQIHFARVSGKILGATLVGHHAGEMISILTLALEQGISAYKLSKMMFPYPTKSELIKKVCNKFVVYTLSHTKDEILYLLKSYALQIST